jgi:hypothetical protein
LGRGEELTEGKEGKKVATEVGGIHRFYGFTQISGKAKKPRWAADRDWEGRELTEGNEVNEESAIQSARE